MKGSFGKLEWGAWFYALVSGFISGGASSCAVGIAAAFVDPGHFAPGSSNLFKLVALMFFSHGLIAAFNFLKQQPLPSKETVKTTTIEAQEGTPTKVTETVQETKVTPQ